MLALEPIHHRDDGDVGPNCQGSAVPSNRRIPTPRTAARTPRPASGGPSVRFCRVEHGEKALDSQGSRLACNDYGRAVRRSRTQGILYACKAAIFDCT
jgi:hypothetical protein